MRVIAGDRSSSNVWLLAVVHSWQFWLGGGSGKRDCCFISSA